MSSEIVPPPFATIAQHKRLIRVLYVCMYSLLGASLAVLATRFITDVKIENWTRYAVVVAMATCLILLYEGHRRYRVNDEVNHTRQVRNLWFAAIFVSALSFVVVLPLGLLARELPGWMGSVIFGLYVGAAMSGMLFFDFAIRPRVATYQVIAAICCSGALYILISLLQWSPSEDRSIIVHALAIALSLAIAYAVIPRYFDDMCVYVVDGSDAKVRAKLMKSGSGFWQMVSGQKQLTIVDGTLREVDKVADPRAILLPEALVPEVASIRRKDHEFVLQLHEQNNDSFRRGVVRLEDEVLLPGREYPLKTGNHIRVGSLVLGVIVPRTRILAALVFLLAGGPALADEKPLFTAYHEWYRCLVPGRDPFAVARFVVNADRKMVPTANLMITGAGDGVTGRVYRYRSRGAAETYDGALGFLSAALTMRGDESAVADTSYLLLVDYSGSMGWCANSAAKRCDFTQSRWMEVMGYLNQSRSLFANQSALLLFDCWGPSPEEVAKMNFTAQVPGLLQLGRNEPFFTFGAKASSAFGVTQPQRPAWHLRDTRLYATLVATLQGLIERTKQIPSGRYKLIVFSDGLNDEGRCAPAEPVMTNPGEVTAAIVQPSRTACADVHRELENARRTGRIDVVLVSHAPAGADNENSLATCVRQKYPGAQCAPCKANDKSCVSFPNLCAATADQATWSQLLTSVGPEMMQLGPYTELFLRPDQSHLYQRMYFKLHQAVDGQQQFLAQTTPGGYAFPLGDLSGLRVLDNEEICSQLAQAPVHKTSSWPWYYHVPLILLCGLMLLVLWLLDGQLSQRFFA